MRLPVVFVHGNGDSAALWQTTIWRFESNGFPRERLFAIDFTFPEAREDDAVPMEGRSGTADQLRELAAFVERVLRETGSRKLALVASSRGANAVRNFVRNGDGERNVSHAVLCGGVNHGVWASPTFEPGSEFNGLGPFLRALNARYPDGNEVSPRVRWLTLRSDASDKYAQPDGAYSGHPGMQTHIGFDAPALRGAADVVLAGADHREVAFGPEAFAAMFHFVAGTAPVSTRIALEDTVVLDGVVSGYRNGAPTNLPLAGATVEVYAVDAATGERLSAGPHRKTIGSDGAWGPLVTTAETALEFVVEAKGHPVTHLYRSPFPRSSRFVHLRPAPAASLSSMDAAASIVTISRPRGYFGVGRNRFEIDGRVPDGVPPGVPAVSSASIGIPVQPRRTVTTRCDDEAIAVINWPAAEGRVVIAEFHY